MQPSIEIEVEQANVGSVNVFVAQRLPIVENDK